MSATPLTLASARAGIDAGNAHFMKCASIGDAAGIGANYTSTALLMPAGSPNLIGPKGAEEFFGSVFKSGVNGVKLTTLEVLLTSTSDAAIEHGEFQMFVGEKRVDYGRYIVQWKQIDGKLLMHWDLFSSYGAEKNAAATQ